MFGENFFAKTARKSMQNEAKSLLLSKHSILILLGTPLGLEFGIGKVERVACVLLESWNGINDGDDSLHENCSFRLPTKLIKLI